MNTVCFLKKFTLLLLKSLTTLCMYVNGKANPQDGIWGLKWEEEKNEKLLTVPRGLSHLQTNAEEERTVLFSYLSSLII